MIDQTNLFITGFFFVARFGSTQKTAVQLLGLVQSSIVAGTNVDIAEVPEVYMSDLPSPQYSMSRVCGLGRSDIYTSGTSAMSRHWIRSLDEKMAIPRRTNQMRFHLPYRFEVNQFKVKNFPRLTNDSFISYIFCLSTGLWSRHLSEYPPVVANCMYNSSHINW